MSRPSRGGLCNERNDNMKTKKELLSDITVQEWLDVHKPGNSIVKIEGSYVFYSNEEEGREG